MGKMIQVMPSILGAVLSVISEYKYEGSASHRFFQLQMFQVSVLLILQVFRMLYIHWRGFLTGGSYVLLVRCFQQFYQFLFSFQH